MMSEWRVTSNFSSGERQYSCYRLRNVKAVADALNRGALG